MHPVPRRLVLHTVRHLGTRADLLDLQIHVGALQLHDPLLVSLHARYQRLLLLSTVLVLLQSLHLLLRSSLRRQVVVHLRIHPAPLHLHTARRQLRVTADAELQAAVHTKVRHSLLAVLPHKGIHTARPLPAALEDITVAPPHRRVHQRQHITVVTTYVHHRVTPPLKLERETVLLSPRTQRQAYKRHYRQSPSHLFFTY